MFIASLPKLCRTEITEVGVALHRKGKACRGASDCMPGDGACPTTTSTLTSTSTPLVPHHQNFNNKDNHNTRHINDGDNTCHHNGGIQRRDYRRSNNNNNSNNNPFPKDADDFFFEVPGFFLACDDRAAALTTAINRYMDKQR